MASYRFLPAACFADTAAFLAAAALLAFACFCEDFFCVDFGDLSPISLPCVFRVTWVSGM